MKDNKRAGFLDEVRGFAIICMVVYHLMYNLQYIFSQNVPIFFEGWFYYIWAVFAGSFIFISGIVCRYSRNNIKRGAQCFFLGMLVTFVTAVVVADNTIIFGILHFLGISMMLFALGEKLLDLIPPLIGLVMNVFMMAVTWNISDGRIGIAGLFFTPAKLLYDAQLLFPLGFIGQDFASADYFPLMPWLFLFLAGAYFGVFVKNGDCPGFFYTTRVPFLAAAGRHTIWIYLLHQPVFFGVLYLIYG
jgi:uncharacterized membrane protein